MISHALYRVAENYLFFINRRFCRSLVPSRTVTPLDSSKLPTRTKINREIIKQLERVSLVDFGNEKGIEIVEEAIRFADQLSLVNTEGVQPLSSVLENSDLRLRNDTIIDGNCSKLILANAKEVEDGYFIAPPGNIPLEAKDYVSKERKQQN